MSAIKQFRTGTVARKLASLVVASLLASFLATAAISTWLDLNRQANLEANRLTQTARVIGSFAASAVSDGDRSGAFTAIRSVSQMPGITYGRVVSSKAGLLAETGAGARLMTDASLEAGDRGLSIWSVLTTGSIEVSAPIVHEGRMVGSITLFSRTPELRGRVLSTLWTTLAGALVSVVAGLIVSMRMARGIASPIVALADLARRVTRSGDYSTRVEVKADGEVADLVAGFDSMLSGIRERDARIAAHVEGLEAEVAARTSELVVARDAAEQANAAKSDFLAVMSHEIRTPLNGILALSDMLASSDLPQRQQRYADVISKSGKSLLSIINDILDFSKVEAGKMDLEETPVDLAEAAEDVASLFSEKAVGKGLDLAVFVDPRLPKVLADPVRLRQVIGNLVNNAIKFTDAGGVLIAIDRDPGDARSIRVAIQDTGPGIPAETLPTLFEAFTQADQSTTRTHGGTGLGLAICDRLVRSMGGTWSLSSVVGEGSTFAFSAPLRSAEDANSPADIEPGRPVGVVDLGPMTTEALRRYLLALDIAHDDGASAAFSAAPRTGPAVIVCDDEASAALVRQRHANAFVMVKPLRQMDVTVVARQLQAGRPPHLEQQAARAKAGLTFPGVRVLVVDDSEVNREVACEALSRLGVETFTAEDGQQAIDRLRTHVFDMVLMDGSMPILDGFEATRRIRAEEADTHRPRAVIVALTAHVVGAGADAWKTSGMDGVIHKPFTLDALTRELFRFCGDRAVEQAATGEPPAQASAAAPDHLFDPIIRGELQQMAAGGRADFVTKVEGLYAANAPLRLSDIQQAAAAGDAEALARAAHALKSMSLSLGCAAVANEASRLETNARAEGLQGAVGVERITALVTATLAAMKASDEPSASILSAEQALKAGIARGDLHLVYQSLVDRTGQPSGKVEALVRWTDPRQGRLSPDDFIPRLEAEGAVSRLTDFVLTRALQDTLARPEIRVSVNASASEFQEPGFATRVAAAAHAVGFPAERLEVEVTETAMLDVDAARRTIDALRSEGFGVALDDFGAGYSSLHALRELKFTTLKVDRSFVERCCQDTASAAIIHAVISVGRALGMKVVCEGVETAEQAEFLRIAGAHFQQGYYFHRPSLIDDLPGARQEAA